MFWNQKRNYSRKFTACGLITSLIIQVKEGAAGEASPGKWCQHLTGAQRQPGVLLCLKYKKRFTESTSRMRWGLEQVDEHRQHAHQHLTGANLLLIHLRKWSGARQRRLGTKLFVFIRWTAGAPELIEVQIKTPSIDKLCWRSRTISVESGKFTSPEK